MVLSFGALGGAARRALFRQFAFAKVVPGVSANAIIGEARTLGLSVRRTDALSIIREVAGRTLSRSTLRNVPDTLIPTLRHYAETRLRLVKRFQTIFEIRGTDILSGEPRTRQISFISDERISLEEAKAQLLELAQQQYGPQEGVTYTEIVPVEGLVRAEPPFTEEG